MKGDRERCVAAGMDDYLTKPIRRDQLAAVLARVAGEAPGPAEGVETSPALDEVAALAHAGDDRQLLGELLGIFLEDGPGHLHALRDAVAGSDPAALCAQRIRWRQLGCRAAGATRSWGGRGDGAQGRIGGARPARPFEQSCRGCGRLASVAGALASDVATSRGNPSGLKLTDGRSFIPLSTRTNAPAHPETLSRPPLLTRYAWVGLGTRVVVGTVRISGRGFNSRPRSIQIRSAA